MNTLGQVMLEGKLIIHHSATIGRVRGGRGRGREIVRSGTPPSCENGVWRTKPELQKSWLISNAAHLRVSLRIGPGRPLKSISASLGFTADPRVGIERAANGLLKDAAMLLLYQDVLKSPPAQAFLKVLLALRRGDDGLKLLESYGEFFRLMAVGRYPSWEDYILEGILSGEKNPFAEASANVGNPRGVRSVGVPPSLRAGAAADLDSLQRLSITESTLSGWVAEIVDVRPEWRTAAASNFSSKNVLTSPQDSEEQGSGKFFGFNISEAKSRDLGDSGDSADHAPANAPLTEEIEGIESGGSRHYTRSFFQEDREVWRKKIGGLWRWSKAVPLLEKYYAEHSVGRVASTQYLRWKGGKMTIDSKWVTKTISACNLSIHHASKEALLTNLTRHAETRAAHHVLLYGPSGTGKTWLLRSVLSEVTCSNDLHIITLPVSDLKSIHMVLEELARHWQLRFALIVDDLLPRGGDENYAYLKSALDGNVQEWPSNVLLCATSPRNVAIQSKEGGPGGHRDLAHLFGLTLRFEDLDEDEFILCVKELLEYRLSRMTIDSGILSEDLAPRAETWAKKLDVWSIRSAAQFVNSL